MTNTWISGTFRIIKKTCILNLLWVKNQTAISRIDIPKERVVEFCRKNGIQRLSLFGSVLSDDFGPDSDVDVPVEFKAGTRIGLVRLMGFEFERIEIIGRKVDLNAPGFISRYFRDDVMAEREVQYAEA